MQLSKCEHDIVWITLKDHRSMGLCILCRVTSIKDHGFDIEQIDAFIKYVYKRRREREQGE